MTALMQMGSLRVVLYKNVDFTNQLDTERVVYTKLGELGQSGGFNLRMDKYWAPKV